MQYLGHKIYDITGCILAGGKSTRFGSDKAFAQLKDVRFIEIILKVLKDVFKEVTKTIEEPIQKKLGIKKSAIQKVSSIFSKAILRIAPDFSKYDTIPTLSRGLLIDLKKILGIFFFLVVIRGGIIFSIGMLIFSKRELGSAV